MKKQGYIMFGMAAAMMASSPAYGQYNPKGETDMLSEADNIQTLETPGENQPVVTTRQEQVMTQVEPAAGYESSSPYDDFTGFYGGLEAGYAIGSYDVNDPAGPDGDAGLDGFNGGVFLGYGFEHNFSWLGGYGGVEIGYEESGADGDLGANSFEKDHAFLATFRPGVTMHQDTLGYGIIGYSRAKFEGDGEDEYLDGLVLGAGAEFDTNTAFKTRLEYTYTNYEDTNLGTTSFDGHENNLKLGVLFRL